MTLLAMSTAKLISHFSSGDETQISSSQAEFHDPVTLIQFSTSSCRPLLVTEYFGQTALRGVLEHELFLNYNILYQLLSFLSSKCPVQCAQAGAALQQIGLYLLCLITCKVGLSPFILS